MARGQRRQQQPPRKTDVSFVRWRRGLSKGRRAFVDALSAEELQHLAEIDDDVERSTILTELIQAATAQKQVRLDTAFTEWYLGLPTDEHRAFVDSLSQEEIATLAELAPSERNQMLEHLIRTKRGQEQKAQADRVAAEIRAEQNFARIENRLHDVWKALSGAAEKVGTQIVKFPHHRENAQQWMREYTTHLRHEGELRRTSPDRPRRFRHIFSALLWLVIVMGSVIIIGLVTR